MKNNFALMLATVALLSATAPTMAQGLNLTVEGVRNSNGSILVLVFDDASAFESLDWTSAIEFADIPARPGRIAHRFTEMAKGPYAILVLHDENGDQNLNHRGQVLLEGVGASGVTSSTPYPNFAQASVGPGNVSVQLYYDE